MDGCNIIDKYIVRSEKYLKGNKIIECIDLSNNYIHDKGGKVLHRLVIHNSSLIRLSLRKNCINLSLLNEIEYVLRENLLNYSVGEP